MLALLAVLLEDARTADAPLKSRESLKNAFMPIREVGCEKREVGWFTRASPSSC